ncbi:hypothetical protein HDU98_010961 [Podochytrium sp. JEL0797]|nr:hypothetical protein HDU98_010961 [Podochytrium sp. JEL0797]
MSSEAITSSAAPATAPIQTLKTVRGAPVSGRPWKSVQVKRSSHLKSKSIQKGWVKQQEDRKQREIVQRMQFEMKEEKRIAKEEKRAEAEERKKRKEENEKRAEVMQMVSAAKVKRMKKKQLKSLKKVGSDVSGSTVKRRKGMFSRATPFCVAFLVLFATCELHSPFAGHADAFALRLAWLVFELGAWLSLDTKRIPWTSLAIALVPLASLVSFKATSLAASLGASVPLLQKALPVVFAVSVALPMFLLGTSMPGKKGSLSWYISLAPTAVCAWFAIPIQSSVASFIWTHGPSPLPMPAEILCGIAILLSVWDISRLLLGAADDSVVGNTTKPTGQQPEKSNAHFSKIFLLSLPFFISWYTLVMTPQFSRTLIASPTAKNQRILEKVYSNTGHISVIEDPSLHNGIRVIRCDHSLLGGVFLMEGYRGDSVYGSFYFLGFVTGFKRDSLKEVDGKSLVEVARERRFKAVNIGLGIGIASKTILQSHPNSHIDVVDLDPEILRLAVEYFEYPNVTAQTTFYAMDGRKFLEDAPDASYDYVLHDVFTNGGVSGRLVSLEALKETRRVLVEDGVLALNFVGTIHSESTLSLIRTIKSVTNPINNQVYPYVACYPESPITDATTHDSFYNMVFFAAGHPLVFDPAQIPDPFASRPRKKKTNSDGESMGYARANMLYEFPELRFEEAVERVQVESGVGGGAVLRDVGVSGEVAEVLREEERVGRRRHWELMVELFGVDFWIMF